MPFSYSKEKRETSIRKVSEVVSAYNDILTKYNDLHAYSDLIKGENIHLTKKLKEAKLALSEQEKEMKKVKEKAK